ncbi:hypothetical protein L7F22_025290 [Adiantum nelumboides]|nr:hypothetical protein [Adiantum nelumboides]
MKSRVPAADMLASFELVVVPEIRAHIREIRGDHGGDWGAFSKALKQEYFTEDSEHVTKKTFLEWVACPKDGLSPMELLRKFERRYAQLSTTKQVSLDAEKVELFPQATGSEIQEKLELLLEDESTKQGLKTEWKDVEDAVSLLAKRQPRNYEDDKAYLGHNFKQDEDQLGVQSSNEVPIVISVSDKDDTMSSSSSILDEDGTWETGSVSSRYNVYVVFHVDKLEANMHKVKANLLKASKYIEQPPSTLGDGNILDEKVD